MKFSAVTTLYKSPEVIRELVERLETCARQIANGSFEIILVDDGCPDGSGDLARLLAAEIPELRVISFSRNFGQHKAIMAGLEASTGDRVFLIDGDLDEEPEWLISFYEKMVETGADVVFGVQPSRRRGLGDRLIGNSAYLLINLLSGIEVHPNMLTARIMTGRYVRALVAHRETVPWLAGLWVLTGFRQVPFEVIKQRRSKTSYSTPEKFWQLILGLTSFSQRPIQLLSLVGAIVFFVGVVAVLGVTYSALSGDLLPGWASVFASLWLLGGLTLMSLGLVGHYLGVIMVEVKHRPYVLVSDDSGVPGESSP